MMRKLIFTKHINVFKAPKYFSTEIQVVSSEDIPKPEEIKLPDNTTDGVCEY